MPYLPRTLPPAHPDPRTRRRWQASPSSPPPPPLPADQPRRRAPTVAPGRSVSLSMPADRKSTRAPADPARAPERLRARSVDMGEQEHHEPLPLGGTMRSTGRPGRPSSAGAGRPAPGRAGRSIDCAPRVARRNSVHATSRSAVPRAWSESDVRTLAETSLAFWIRGQRVDFRRAAHHLQRTEKDVRAMLQLMLQENALFAHSTHWAGSDQRVVGAWAAAEFPQCSTLNLGRTRSWRLSGLSSLDRCLSTMWCRRPQDHGSWIVDAAVPGPDAVSHAPADAVPNVEILESVDTIPAHPTPPAVEAVAADAAADAAQGRRAEAAKPLPALPTGDFTFSPPSAAAPVPRTLPKRPNDSITVSSARRPQSQRRRTSAAATTGPPPVAKAAPMASKADAATMTSASDWEALLAGHASPAGATPRVEAATTTADSASAQVCVQEHAPTMSTMPPDAPPAARTASPAAPSASPPNEDAGADEMPESVARLIESLDDGAGDEWLLPEQNSPPHEVTRIDGDIDMGHLDMSGERRKLIRKLIEDYVAAYYGGFCLRIHREDIAVGLCDIAQCAGIADLASNKYRARIDVEMRRLTSCHGSTIDMASANTHFYTYISGRLCEDHIFPTDTVWGSASKYATSVFNRMLEDVHFLAYEADPHSRAERRGPAWRAAERRMCAYRRERLLGFVARVSAMTHVRYAGVHLYFDRIENCGAAPIPAAPEYDNDLSEDDMQCEMECPWSNVAMRDTLHTMVMTTLPRATNESIMAAMQQAIAAYNMSVVEFVRLSRGANFVDALERRPGAASDVGACEAALAGRRGQALSVEQAGVLARCLADRWLDSLRSSLLAWLMVDHQFRPVPLAEMRRWIFENQSPRGQDIEFIANLHLYKNIKGLGMRISEAKWLYASAVMTLRLIACISKEASRTTLLSHIDVRGYAALFARLVEKEAHRTAPRKKSSASHRRRRRLRHQPDEPASAPAQEEAPEALAVQEDAPEALLAQEEVPEALLASTTTPQPAPSLASAEERLARLEAEMAGLRLDFGQQFGRILSMLEAQSRSRA